MPGLEVRVAGDGLHAVIDIGSHSVRLRLGEARGGRVRQLEYLWVPIALGNDTFGRGTVSNTTIAELVSALRNFREVLASYRAGEPVAIATSGIRGASNADMLLERVRAATGIRIEVIEPVAEALLLRDAVARRLDGRGYQKKELFLYSLGAGGTQFVHLRGGLARATDTQNEGTLRLARSLDMPDKALAGLLRYFAERIVASARVAHGVGPVDALVVANDDALGVVKRLVPGGEEDGLWRLPAKEFGKLFGELLELDADELARRFGLAPAVAATTRVAVHLLAGLAPATGAAEVLFPDVSLAGALLDRLAALPAGADGAAGDPLAAALGDVAVEFRADVLAAAEAIGAKYRYDEKHAAQVRFLAVALFDGLAPTWGFAPRERVWLEVAATLHDIGHFVGAKGHHKHSAMLIGAAELLGLSSAETRLVAQVARYHRKGGPKETHVEYAQLPPDDRLAVYRLASLLRIADALAAPQLPRVEALAVEPGEDRCLLRVRAKGGRHDHLGLLESLVRRKGDFFESFFGQPLAIARLEQ